MQVRIGLLRCFQRADCLDEKQPTFRVRTDQRGGVREARCECNDQVELCG